MALEIHFIDIIKSDSTVAQFVESKVPNIIIIAIRKQVHCYFSAKKFDLCEGSKIPI